MAKKSCPKQLLRHQKHFKYDVVGKNYQNNTESQSLKTIGE